MLRHTNAALSRIRAITPLVSKVFELTAPRDGAGKITATAPYVVAQPSDGRDEQTRFTGGKITYHPRVVLHIVGSSYANAQTVTELIKAEFIDAGGFGIQIDVTGERGRSLYWEAQPTQKDDDITPPLIYNTVELGWISEPV